jgi:Kef-type K+ transport system membrane component KefB
MPLAAIQAPEGAVLEFFLLFAVILLGPIIFSRAGLPGLIGLLLGGFAIGPHGLGLIGSGNQTIPELGQLGLLYLMFVAGLELDLHVLQAYRRAAVSFGVLTFAFPFIGGVAVGLALGWSLPATLLLGSLLASHTLILYPTIRDAGLGDNPAVASAVGATVLTDTMALVVLAVVAGTETGSGSATVVVLEIGIGLVVLLVTGLLLLPRVAAAAMGLWGDDRVARYLVAILSFLFMAMLAEVFGIEGLVGAFFAGLALNRLVPNEGPSMERIEFFGAAVFVPVFLVSVGLLLDPSVMFTWRTLGLAALLCVACIGGKAIAAALARPLLHFSTPETGAMFVLTTPQAAATLASTLIGFQIGLFGTSVVNAVLVLILVSIVVSTLFAQRVVRWIAPRPRRASALGERVLLVTTAQGPSSAAVQLVALLARPDGGLADVLVTRTEGESPLTRAERRSLEKRVFGLGLDGEVRTVVSRDMAGAVEHGLLAGEPTIVVVDDPRSFDLAAARVPMLLLHGSLSAPTGPIRIAGDSGTTESDGVTAEVARRLRKVPGRSGGRDEAPKDGTTLVVRRFSGPGDAKALLEDGSPAIVALVIEPRPEVP